MFFRPALLRGTSSFTKRYSVNWSHDNGYTCWWFKANNERKRRSTRTRKRRVDSVRPPEELRAGGQELAHGGTRRLQHVCEYLNPPYPFCLVRVLPCYWSLNRTIQVPCSVPPWPKGCRHHELFLHLPVREGRQLLPDSRDASAFLVFGLRPLQLPRRTSRTPPGSLWEVLHLAQG